MSSWQRRHAGAAAGLKSATAERQCNHAERRRRPWYRPLAGRSGWSRREVGRVIRGWRSRVLGSRLTRVAQRRRPGQVAAARKLWVVCMPVEPTSEVF